MALESILGGKPSPIPLVATHVPEREDVPEVEETEHLMSVSELHQAIRMIRAKRQKLDIFGAEVGSTGRIATAQNSLLTGV